MVDNVQGQIQEKSDFANDKAGLYQRWDAELQAAWDAEDKWHRHGNKVVNRFLDRRGAGEEDWFRLNLFYSNITTLRSMLFGKLPEINFDRANTDFNDDVARIASTMMQRALQNDIGTPNDQYSDCLRMNLDDRLIPGLGISRVRYEFDEETIQHAAQLNMEGVTEVEAYEETIVTDERAPIEYVHWRDFSWSPCRTWAECRWIAFRSHLTRDQLITRFGEDIGKKIPLVETQITKDETMWVEKDDPRKDAWSRGEIWEIWNRSDKRLYWYCKGFETILDVKDDPLGLTGYFPIPKPMAANLTTSAYMPIPDFVMAQDLYNEIDKLETRISLITEAVKVVGVYDKSAQDLERMFIEGVENDLIPVDNWAMFAEKGGLQGTIDWMPYDTIAGVIKELVGRRNDVKAQLFEITGMSDIMRGAQAAGGAVTATERALEARFASVRVQALQDEFANYATDLIRLRAEVMSDHFSPESIIKQSNINESLEGQHNPEIVQAAVALIKNQKNLIWRISVKPESVAMVDYAQLKEERTSYITALATFMQSAAPLVELKPELQPLLLELLKWGLAGFKGSSEVEGLIDFAVEQANAQPQDPNEQDPEAQKAQADQQMKQLDMQAEQQKIAGQIQLEQTKHQSRIEQITLEGNNRITELQMETQQDIIKENAQLEANKEEETHETAEFKIREAYRASLKPEPANAE